MNKIEVRITKICPIMSNHEGFNFRECQEDKCAMWTTYKLCGLMPAVATMDM